MDDGRSRSFREHADQARDELSSVRDFVRWGASRFAEAGLCFEHGCADALDESTALVLHALHLEPRPPSEIWGARLTRRERSAVVALLRRRVVERIPAAYLIGHTWFAGLRFRSDPRALVPRSPLAECIERGFAPWRERDEVVRVLDIGTGSGCIAVACAEYFPAARVDAVDIDRDALALAAENVRDHGLEERVRLIESDLFAGVDAAYDLAIANPPYVGREEYESLPPEYGHEPIRGLRAGEDGVDVIARILEEAPRHLGSGGLLVVEAGSCRPALETRYPGLPFTWLELERGGENVFLLRRDELPGSRRSVPPSRPAFRTAHRGEGVETPR